METYSWFELGFVVLVAIIAFEFGTSYGEDRAAHAAEANLTSVKGLASACVVGWNSTLEEYSKLYTQCLDWDRGLTRDVMPGAKPGNSI
jgi:hypothetical protein